MTLNLRMNDHRDDWNHCRLEKGLHRIFYLTRYDFMNPANPFLCHKIHVDWIYKPNKESSWEPFLPTVETLGPSGIKMLIHWLKLTHSFSYLTLFFGDTDIKSCRPRSDVAERGV